MHTVRGNKLKNNGIVTVYSDDVLVDGNIVYNDSIVCNSGSETENITISNNLIKSGTISIGASNKNVLIEGNQLIDGLIYIAGCLDFKMSDNYIEKGDTYSVNGFRTVSTANGVIENLKVKGEYSDASIDLGNTTGDLLSFKDLTVEDYVQAYISGGSGKVEIDGFTFDRKDSVDSNAYEVIMGYNTTLANGLIINQLKSVYLSHTSNDVTIKNVSFKNPSNVRILFINGSNLAKVLGCLFELPTTHTSDVLDLLGTPNVIFNNNTILKDGTTIELIDVDDIGAYTIMVGNYIQGRVSYKEGEDVFIGNTVFDGVEHVEFPIGDIAYTPTSATDTGTKGQVKWDANYVYVCVDTNTWKRSPLSTW
jgi:hypothetical protein